MRLLDDLLADLAAETAALRAVVDAAVETSGEVAWLAVTPAPRWTVATQIAHLAWTDVAATLAARAGTPAGKQAWDELVLAALGDPDGFVDASAEELAAQPRAELLTRWSDGARDLAHALRAVPDGERLPWFGPPMSPTSMATARFMETWAHGLDVRAALAVEAEPTARIRHVAHLGVRTRGFAFAAHGLEPPAAEVRVELTAPDGDLWGWGPENAPDRVTGSAWDFCRLVTQRVHRADTDLVATDGAEPWLAIAQAFAGPPGVGREAGREAGR